MKHRLFRNQALCYAMLACLLMPHGTLQAQTNSGGAAPSNVPPPNTAPTNTAPVNAAAPTNTAVAPMATTEGAAPIDSAAMPVANGGTAPGGLQDKTTIDYRDAPLIDAIRHLADNAKVNIAVAPAVSALSNAKLTIRLTDITYDTALKTILDLFHLGAVLEDGVMRIDTMEALNRERDDKNKQKQDKWKLEPTRVLVWQLNAAKATDLANIVRESLKTYAKLDDRFSVQADARSNKLIIEGVPDALTRAKTLIEGLDRRKQQVVIEARIVEASNEVNRTLRVNWGARFGFDASRGISTGIVFPNSIVGNMGGAGSVAPLGVGRANPEPGAFGFTLGSINGLINIDGILRAYEKENLANIVASPTVTVQDNEKAHFDESFVVSHFVVQNGQPALVSFKSALSLDVTPLIASDNSIELDIDVRRDTPTTGPTDPVQGKIERNAKTRLVVRNGDTAVLGGLYQTTKKKGQERIPLLGKIPFIGWLFRTDEDYTTRTELMILITPRIQSGNGGAAGVANSAPQPEVPSFTNTGGSSGGAGLNPAQNPGNISLNDNHGNGEPAPGAMSTGTGDNAGTPPPAGNGGNGGNGGGLPNNMGSNPSGGNPGGGLDGGPGDDLGAGGGNTPPPSNSSGDGGDDLQ